MQVTIVVRRGLHDGHRPVQPRARPDEHTMGTGSDKAVDEVLGESEVDVAGAGRRTFTPVAARIVDVHVEAVLMRRVADGSEPSPEVATARAAEISDDNTASVRML